MWRRSEARAPLRASLRRQLLLWVVLPLLPLVAVNAWLARDSARAAGNQAFDRSLQASARSIAEHVSVTDGELTVDIPVVALEMFESHFQDRVFYRVAFVGGRELTGNAALPLPVPLPPAFHTAFYDVRYQDAELRVAAYLFPFYYGGSNRLMVVQVGETTLSRQALAGALLRESLLHQLLLAAVAALFAAIGIHRVLRPVRNLGQVLAERGGDPELRLDPALVQQELKPLLLALNQALEQLQQQLAVRQRFIADAAHQLRTPLTLLKTQAQFAAAQGDDMLRARALAALEGSTDQLIRLAGQLLALSRLEPGSRRHEWQQLDLARLAREVSGDFILDALARGLDLGYEGEQSVPLRGDALMLREMLANLIDNALRYTPTGGVVTVRLVPESAGFCLSVSDSGPGIALAQRRCVFERFNRGGLLDGAGCGLGLAIVEEVANSHEASVTIEEAAEGGALLRVSFPA
ncbi:sensor histidine kinase [Craterilacuibacter sp.]|uniref:sensor histidine kinase n=1 Tax=Craterilacuibacter sp. TaxID=2870909 RepID=UPI003F345468